MFGICASSPAAFTADNAAIDLRERLSRAARFRSHHKACVARSRLGEPARQRAAHQDCHRTACVAACAAWHLRRPECSSPPTAPASDRRGPIRRYRKTKLSSRRPTAPSSQRRRRDIGGFFGDAQKRQAIARVVGFERCDVRFSTLSIQASRLARGSPCTPIAPSRQPSTDCLNKSGSQPARTA